MPVEDLSDDYVAQLLANDAKTSASKYSSYGLQAFLPRRSNNNAPKPNTRFLKNIIKETDNHNAAVKAKEEQEARARLRELRRSSSDPALSQRPREKKAKEKDSNQSRRRKVDEINGILDGSAPAKRRRVDEINGILNGRSRDCKKTSRSDKEGDRSSLRHRHSRHHDDDETSEGDDDDEDRKSRRHRHRHHDNHQRRHHSESEEDPQRDEKRPRTRAKWRSGSPRSHRKDRDDYHRSSRRRRKRSTSSSTSRNLKDSHPHPNHESTTRLHPSSKDEENDSDPLESLGLIGPRPAPQILSRGRGTFATNPSASTIDAHFKSSYDPTVDVIPDIDDDADDWDQALEALKDRRKWQQNQAERMRLAGFSEVEVAKWERGKGGVGLGGEGREEDVRWSGRGEGREWDRGKVVEADGDGDGEGGVVEWGRLKGT